VYWHSVLNVYGTVREGLSQIWLENPYMDTEIVGTINYHPTDDRMLIFNIDADTLPQNTLDPVVAVINPLLKGPDDIAIIKGIPLVAGDKVLIVESIGSVNNTNPSIAWGNIVANANDIIEFDGVEWFVYFDSTLLNNVQYVTNLNTQVQYRYTAGAWMKSWEGWYDQGSYSIVI
jgi:hypothetical protein